MNNTTNSNFTENTNTNTNTTSVELQTLPERIGNTEKETEIIKEAIILELKKYFNHHDDQIYIENRSAGHRNHQQDAGGHYYIEIISQQFLSKNTLARQRLIHQLLKGWLPNRIHSLELSLKTLDEVF